MSRIPFDNENELKTIFCIYDRIYWLDTFKKFKFYSKPCN